MSKYLETLPQYHFDRDDFCKVFGEVFTDDEIIDIDVMCGYPQNTENFLLYRWEDEFYIIHRDSGTIINWYKHLGRTNTCNKKGFLPQRVFFTASISGSLKIRRKHNAVSRKTRVGTALEPIPS